MDNNFINLTDIQKDSPLFRVFTVQRLFEIFTEGMLTLVRPSKWDDPFENYIMNATGELENGQLFSIGFRDNFYGQCWTFTRESDALWRIYAPNKDGVRVTCSARKLLKALYDQAGEFKSHNSFVGKVSYFKTKELTAFLNDQDKMQSLILDQSGRGQALSLLFKRYPFKHENEVRLIYNSLSAVANDIYKFPFDPIANIEEIIFDPRMKYAEYKKYKSQLRKFGYKGKIVKSNLYRVPNLKFKFKLD